MAKGCHLNHLLFAYFLGGSPGHDSEEPRFKLLPLWKVAVHHGGAIPLHFLVLLCQTVSHWLLGGIMVSFFLYTYTQLNGILSL